ADLRGMLGAIGVFGAHCGDVPTTLATWSAAKAISTGTATCAAALGGDVAVLGQIVTDTTPVAMGPFYASLPTPPAGWAYTYTRTGTGAFRLTGTSAKDFPAGLTYP